MASRGDFGGAQPPRQSVELRTPHDRLFSWALQRIETARSLLASHLPGELVQYLELSTLTSVDTSLIDSNLSRRYLDRLYSAEMSEELESQLGLPDRCRYLMVLIDHKSRDKADTLTQMLGYIARIWELAPTSGQPLVPILPWVVYNGVHPWRSARRLDQLFSVPEAWKRYVPRMEVPIFDIVRTPDAGLVGEPILRLTLTLLKHARSRDWEVSLRSVLRSIGPLLDADEVKNLSNVIRTYVMSVNPELNEGKIDSVLADFWPFEPEPGSVADQLIRQGVAIGEERGEARGEARGRMQERIKTIQMLQSILGASQSSDEELSSRSLEELQAIVESLQQKLMPRSQ